MNLLKGACIEPLYADLPFLERFDAAKRDGFDFVEFWSWTDKDIAATKKAADNAGIRISGFNGDAALSLIDHTQKQAYLDFLKRSMETAHTLGARSVTIHSNGLGEGGVVINHYDDRSLTEKTCAMFDTLCECARIGEAAGVTLNLEALNIVTDHVGNFLTHTADAAAMTRLIGSPRLKILYDVYHMHLNEGNIIGNIAANLDQIGHVHIADAPGRHEPGTGEINYPSVLSFLEKAGYTGIVGAELVPQTDTTTAVKAIMAAFDEKK
jgi:hydroxypyruvate isomerase